jgi:hypothetical protein
MEEVADMEIFVTNRPWTPLDSVCASSALLPVPAAPVASPAVNKAAIVRSVAVLAAERAPVSREHQVQVQAELAQVLLLVDETNGINGTTSTTGFMGIDSSATKRYADGGSGVPPRGRPV